MARYLILDRRLLNPQATGNIQLIVEPSVKDEVNNPLLMEEKPWETQIDNGYPDVLCDREAKVYRCYYTSFIEDGDNRKANRGERAAGDYIPRPNRAPGLAYAESVDGVHWVRPCLNRVEWQGSRKNNLVFIFAHGTGVMIDEREADAARRYRMVTKMDRPGKEAYMAVSSSPDGADWETPIP